ncbi:hypothetical protein B0H14DRAFT_3604269 [Mycena olivaceomarginata]|nr:hypothetical protein B0H14DRAFT_3604269 [Mycena olivaceomarginata]
MNIILSHRTGKHHISCGFQRNSFSTTNTAKESSTSTSFGWSNCNDGTVFHSSVSDLPVLILRSNFHSRKFLQEIQDVTLTADKFNPQIGIICLPFCVELGGPWPGHQSLARAEVEVGQPAGQVELDPTQGQMGVGITVSERGGDKIDNEKPAKHIRTHQRKAQWGASKSETTQRTHAGNRSEGIAFGNDFRSTNTGSVWEVIELWCYLYARSSGHRLFVSPYSPLSMLRAYDSGKAQRPLKSQKKVKHFKTQQRRVKLGP